MIFTLDLFGTLSYSSTVSNFLQWEQRAQTMSRARKKLVHRSKRSDKAFREAVSARVMAMEEPLRHATQFCQAIQIAYSPADEEMEALAFVASEAFIRLEFVQNQLRAIFAALSGKDGPEEIDRSHLPGIRRGLEQMRARKFATDEEVEAAFRGFDPY